MPGPVCCPESEQHALHCAGAHTGVLPCTAAVPPVLLTSLVCGVWDRVTLGGAQHEDNLQVRHGVSQQDSMHAKDSTFCCCIDVVLIACFDVHRNSVGPPAPSVKVGTSTREI